MSESTSELTSTARMTTAEQEPAGEPRRDAMRASKPPVGVGPATPIGVLLSLVVIGLGVVAIRDTLVAAGALGGTAWTTAALESVDGLEPATWLLPLGVVAALLGLVLLVTALRPRPRTSVALEAQTGVFISPGDVAKLATNAAEGVAGVISASTSATRRKVRVHVRTTGDSSTAQAVREAVKERMSALSSTPSVKVTTRDGGGS